MAQRPLYHLVQGMPGSSKSQVLLWIRDYFQTVWLYVHGDEFVIVAGMNSMADNIGGVTLHSYFGSQYINRQGVLINSGDGDENWVKKRTRMKVLKFIFIDEIENAGAELLGQAEEQTRRNTKRPDVYRYPTTDQTQLGSVSRAWGGVNLLLIGDWWQLNPTGGIAVMSNPHATKVLESASANATMTSL